MTKDENLIHLKFNYNEAISGKKDILSSEVNTLNITKHIGNYKKLRVEELKNKERIRLRIKSLKMDIVKLERILPKIKIPKILRKDIEKIPTLEEVENLAKYGTVEEQLLLIQKKLKALEKN